MHPHPPRRRLRRDYTEPRRWQPLTDAEWDALLPFVPVREGPGRPLRDARARMDAIFRTAAAGPAWAAAPPRFGKPDAASRHFRRLSHAGLWERPLRALARPDAPPALLAIEHRVCRACRRASRPRGLRLVVLARRPGFLSALRGPSWLLPDPDLPELVLRRLDPVLGRLRTGAPRVAPPGFLRTCRYLLGAAAGRRRIPRHLEPA
jgi:transposase